jgi:hypothetical protein
MDGAKLFACMIVILGMGITAKADEIPYTYKKPLRLRNTKYLRKTASETTNTLTENTSRYQFTPSKISMIIPSFVVHGIKPGKNAVPEMPRKMSEDGQMVMTPGAGLEYKSETGYLMVGAVIKDCYDNLAGTIQIGHQYEITDRVSWGITMGVYARQTPISCDVVQDGPFQRTECQTLDNFTWKILTTINGQSVDIIPMPFLHFTVAAFKSRDFQVDLKLMSNFILNEVGIGIPF